MERSWSPKQHDEPVATARPSEPRAEGELPGEKQVVLAARAMIAASAAVVAVVALYGTKTLVRLVRGSWRATLRI